MEGHNYSMEYFYLGATWTLGNLGDLDFGKFANNLDQTCSKWINLFKLDQIVSKWLNVVQNRLDGFKTDQIFTLKCLLAMGGP